MQNPWSGSESKNDHPWGDGGKETGDPEWSDLSSPLAWIQPNGGVASRDWIMETAKRTVW